jgi:hypothetical protein
LGESVADERQRDGCEGEGEPGGASRGEGVKRQPEAAGRVRQAQPENNEHCEHERRPDEVAGIVRNPVEDLTAAALPEQRDDAGRKAGSDVGVENIDPPRRGTFRRSAPLRETFQGPHPSAFSAVRCVRLRFRGGLRRWAGDVRYHERDSTIAISCWTLT